MRKLKPALNNINTIEYTKKTKFVMGLSASEYPILIYHGSTGNGKSMTGSLKFFTRVINAPRSQQTFVLAGRDITALERRFVKSNNSVFNWAPFKGSWEYKKQGTGGATIIVKTRTGKKNIYLTPFNNVSAYSRILGETINGVFVDEAVEADEMFMEEIVARINRTQGSWGIFTSNGGDPQHYFYTHMIDKSMRIEEVLDGVIPTPDAEVRYYDEVGRDPKMLTVHMGLEDNPVYDKEQLARFYRMYAAGSFMYNSRILGVRGFTQNTPFSPYMDEKFFIKRDKLLEEGFYPTRITFSVDIGGHVFGSEDLKVKDGMFGKIPNDYKRGDYGTTKGGHTVMLTVGWTKDYSRAIVLDVFFPNHMQEAPNVERMYERVYNISSNFPRVRKPYLFYDGTSPSMGSSLITNRRGVDQIRPAVKRDSSINLNEVVGISAIQQYLMSGRLKGLDTPEIRNWFYEAMVQASLESDGKLVDNKDWQADVQDTLLQTFTSMFRALVREG